MSSGGPRFVMGGQERAFVGQLDFLPRYELLTRFLDSLRLIPAERGIDETVPATHTVSIPDGSPQSLGQALYVHHNGETPQYRAFLEAVRTLLPEVNTLTTRAVGDNKVTISVRDELAGDLSLKRVGSGVGQLLYIIASILFSEPGRLFLIDEPTVHLHPAAERQLADFLLEHHEHEYICATHAAAFINAGRPQATWLVRRGVDGINVHGSEDVQALRRHLAAQTGITPADAVLWEKIILVEDEFDARILTALCERLGYKVGEAAIRFFPIGTGDPSNKLLATTRDIAAEGGMPVEVWLDGDKRAKQETPGVDFLPVDEVEAFLTFDPEAIVAALADFVPAPETTSNDIPAWTSENVRTRLEALREEGKDGKRRKGKKILIDLCDEFGFRYASLSHGPMIAEAVAAEHLYAYTEFFERLLA